jgi:PAS domain S-box-containing protein
MMPMKTHSDLPMPPAPDASVGNSGWASYFVESLADMAYMKGVDGRYVVMNAAAARFLGKPVSEIVGRDDFALFPAEQARRIVAQDRAVLASGEPATFDEELLGAGGATWLQTVKSVCRDASGAVIGLVGISRDVGERKRLEEVLRERERQLVEAQRIAGLGTWRWERATDTVTWSDEIYEVFGRDRSVQPPGHAALLGMEGPATLRGLVRAFDRAVRFGEPYTLDMELRRADGTSSWIIARGEVERWENGVVASLRGTVQEITERKQLEMALRRREQELMEAQRIAGIGTWRFDCATRVTEWSAEIYRIYGMDPLQPPLGYDEFLKRATHSANEVEFIERFERLLRAGEPYEMDIEVKLPDGSSRWTISRAEPEHWVDGRVVSVRGTVHEITERKRHEEELALSENRYRSLAHASSQIVWTSDADGSQMKTVPAWQGFTGQSDAEVLGYGWSDAIHPEDRDEAVRLWREAVANGTPYALEQRVRRHDGEYRDMAVHAVPVRDATDRIVEWVGTHTDITERKSAEEESRRAHQRLEDVFESITDGLCATSISTPTGRG